MKQKLWQGFMVADVNTTLVNETCAKFKPERVFFAALCRFAVYICKEGDSLCKKAIIVCTISDCEAIKIHIDI